MPEAGEARPDILVVSREADRLAAERLVAGEDGRPPRYEVVSIGSVAAMERWPGARTVVLWHSAGPDSANAMQAIGERLHGGTKTVKYLVGPSPCDAVEIGIADWSRFLPWAKPLIRVWSNGSFEAAVAEFAGVPLPEAHQAPESPLEPPDAAGTGSPDEPAAEEFLASLVTLDASIPEQEPADLQPEVPAYERSIVFAAVQRDAWGVPSDLWEATHLPEPPPGCLPACVEDYRLDRSALRGVDPSQAGISIPVAAAALIRESIYLQMTRNDPGGWKERARIWGAVIGDPSTRKGVGIEIGEGYLKHIDLRFRAEEERAKEEHFHASKVHDGHLADYYKAAKKDPLAPRPSPPERPLSQRLWTDDATLESLGGLLSAHARGKVAILKDELAGWFGGFDAYKNGKSDVDKPTYLSSYEGHPKYIDRATAGKAYYLPSWSVCILGGIQPSVLASIASKLGHDGMLQRFMLCTSRPADEGEERQPDTAATGRWQAICENLHAMEPHPNGPTMLSASAQEFRKECGRWIHATIKASAMSPALQAALGKWEGLLGRLMLTFHCIDCADKGRPMPDAEISRHTAEQAWSYIQRFIWPHAAHFYEQGTRDSKSQQNLKWVCGAHILGKGWERFNIAMLSSSWSGYRDLDARGRRELLAQLELIGWIRPVGGMAHDGKASDFAVNPAIHDGRFAEQRSRYAAERDRHRASYLERREPGSDD